MHAALKRKMIELRYKQSAEGQEKVDVPSSIRSPWTPLADNGVEVKHVDEDVRDLEEGRYDEVWLKMSKDKRMLLLNSKVTGVMNEVQIDTWNDLLAYEQLKDDDEPVKKIQTPLVPLPWSLDDPEAEMGTGGW